MSTIDDPFDAPTLRSTEQARLGVPVRRRDRGVADQIGLATKWSPVVASRRLAGARAMVADLPETVAALAAGRVSELGASHRPDRRHRHHHRHSPTPTERASDQEARAG